MIFRLVTILMNTMLIMRIAPIDRIAKRKYDLGRLGKCANDALRCDVTHHHVARTLVKEDQILIFLIVREHRTSFPFLVHFSVGFQNLALIAHRILSTSKHLDLGVVKHVHFLALMAVYVGMLTEIRQQSPRTALHRPTDYGIRCKRIH